MSFFINEAWADAASQAGVQHDSGMFSLVMIGAVFVLFYFMIIRPQNKRAKEQREMITQLKKGDEVITSGGIIAKVIGLDDQYLKISPAEGIEMLLQKSAISAVLPKGTMKSL